VVDTGAPTGFVGLTSSKGVFVLLVGEGFGSGPSKLSGVGDGAGFTRRGRDCAFAVRTEANTMSDTNRVRMGILFISVILSDNHRVLQIANREEILRQYSDA
jgi:hypothetical protein